MLLLDDRRVIVGSINLAPGSFDSRRELGIEVTDDHIVKRMMKIVRHDWKHSHPLDLTDKGLLQAELEKHKIDEAGALAIRRKKTLAALFLRFKAQGSLRVRCSISAVERTLFSVHRGPKPNPCG